jgi:hypothetical protein
MAKKVPIPGEEFSSQSYGAALDIEVSDSADIKAIQTRLQQMYKVLKDSVNQQIEENNQSKSFLDMPPEKNSFLNPDKQENPLTENSNPKSNGTNNSGSNHRPCTDPQKKAIWAISKVQKISQKYLIDNIFSKYGVKTPDELSIKEASEVINYLKDMNLNNNSFNNRR